MPWLLPVLAGFVGLAVLTGIGKMVLDFKNFQREMERPRERWEVEA
jgi:hypothetical protein